MEKSVHSACIEIGKEVGYDFSRFSVRAVSAAGSSTPMAITTQYSASRLKGQDPSARPQIDVNPELVEKCGGLQQCSRFILLHELSHELRDSREMLTGKAFDALQTRSKSLARQLGASDSIRVGSILDEAAVDGSAIALGLEQQRLGRTPGERRQAMAEAWLQAEKGTESTIAASGPAFEAVHRARQYATGYALAAGEWASPEAKNSFMNELAGIGRRFQEAAGRVLSAEGTRQLFDAAIDASTLGLATLDQASSAAAMRDPAMLMKSFRAAESVRDYVASAVACFGTKASPELRTWLPGGEQFNAMSVKYKKFGDLPLEQMQQEAFSGIAQALESASGRLFGGQEERVDAILNFTKGLYR